MTFRSLTELVEGLRTRDRAARDELERRCRNLLDDLLTEVQERFLLDFDRKRMVWRSLRYLAHRLMNMTAAELVRLDESIHQQRYDVEFENDWGDLFRSFVFVTTYLNILPGPVVIMKQVSSLFPDIAKGWVQVEPLREAVTLPPVRQVRYEVLGSAFDTFTVQLPPEELSGDAAIAKVVDDSLWVIVGDATGHDPAAHRAIEIMKNKWNKAFNRLPRPLQPLQVLERLEELLLAYAPKLPDGMFVEAILARFGTPEGVTVAGGGRLAFHSASARAIAIELLTGNWLGMRREIGKLVSRSQMDFPFSPGDEVTLASDGLWEHPYGESILFDALPDAAYPVHSGRSLHEVFMELLMDIEWMYDRNDDLTVVTVRNVPQPQQLP